MRDTVTLSAHYVAILSSYKCIYYNNRNNKSVHFPTYKAECIYYTCEAKV